MLIIDIPGRGRLELEHLVLDLNGTLALDGVVLEGVADRLRLVRAVLAPVVLTADTHGGAARLAAALGVDLHVLGTPPGREALGDEAEAKAAFVKALDAARVVAFGNGLNDVEMLTQAAVGVCVVGPEGACAHAMTAADVVVTSITDAFDLLLHPRRLVATLRR